jgi:hypothetical protein
MWILLQYLKDYANGTSLQPVQSSTNIYIINYVQGDSGKYVNILGADTIPSYEYVSNSQWLPRLMCLDLFDPQT